jgi:hypothetical protein
MKPMRSIIVLTLLIVIAIAPPVRAQEQPSGDADTAQAILDEIRATNDLRAALSRERAAWDDERSRLEILKATLAAERDRWLAAAESSRAAAAALVAEANAARASAADPRAARRQLRSPARRWALAPRVEDPA